MKITGLEEVFRNLNKEVEKIQTRTQAGMIVAAIKVRRATEKETPKTPVDTGNLRSSFFVVTPKTTPQGESPKFRDDKNGQMAGDHAVTVAATKAILSKKLPAVGFGFSANYAMHVHEMVDGKFQRPGAGAKFLDTHLKNMKDEILQTIGMEAQIQ
jgi:hypothetical protein